jgi:hypothetical protein
MWLFVIGWFLDSSGGGRGLVSHQHVGGPREENVGPPYPLTNPFAPISEADWVDELTGVVHSLPPFSNSTSKSQNKWMDGWMDG